MKNIYDENMDKECIILCNAINACDGLQTFESCCGHGKSTFGIWLTAKHHYNLFPLARAISKNYDGFNWHLWPIISDTEEYLISFWFESEAIGEYAYQEADLIAKRIYELLKHKEAMKLYKNAIKLI